MKSIISLKEEKQYFNRIYMLLPLYMGILFTVIIYLIYNLLYLIIEGRGFHWNGKFILIAFVLGLFEGASTIYLTHRQNKKDFTYYEHTNKKAKTDFFVPVTMEKGFLKNKRGILVVTKEKVEFYTNQVFGKTAMFSQAFSDTNISIKWEENSRFKKIATLTKGSNILHLVVNEEKLRFVIPCKLNLTHRLITHPVLGKKPEN